MKLMKTVLLIILGCLLPLVTVAQKSSTVKNYSFEELDLVFEQEDKPAVIFLHTQWCKYCKAMIEDTFTDKKVTAIMNQNFYYVPFDAESKEEVIFKNVKFSYKPTGYRTGIHDIAQELLSQNQDKSYPVLVIINKDLEILYQYSGFLDEQEVTKILTQFI
jgi:thioredoxin-related protein